MITQTLYQITGKNKINYLVGENLNINNIVFLKEDFNITQQINCANKFKDSNLWIKLIACEYLHKNKL